LFFSSARLRLWNVERRGRAPPKNKVKRSGPLCYKQLTPLGFKFRENKMGYLIRKQIFQLAALGSASYGSRKQSG
jgi:hypothetical protein